MTQGLSVKLSEAWACHWCTLFTLVAKPKLKDLSLEDQVQSHVVKRVDMRKS